MGQNLLASITHVNVGDVVVILVLLVFFWLDYAQVRKMGQEGKRVVRLDERRLEETNEKDIDRPSLTHSRPRSHFNN